MTALLRPQTQRLADADRIVAIPSFQLESGQPLEQARVHMRLHGAVEAPKIMVLGGISATRRLTGGDGWWPEIVGAGAGIDTDRFCALGVDFAPEDDVLAPISPADQARLIELALDRLGVERLHGFVGASYGGMVGLALAQRAPQRVGRLCVISAAHEPAPLASAWRGVQRRIVEFALASGDVGKGLSLARQLAMISYRSAQEFETRFDRGLDESNRSELDRYLCARGDAFSASMPPRRWLSLSSAIDRTKVDPARVLVPTTLVACSSDQLAPLAQMEDFSRRLPRLTAFHVLNSIYGHDAFLKEPGQISRVLRRFLNEAAND